MESILQDLRYAARSLARSPFFFLIAVGSLALGIGANTTIFSAVDVFMLRPLPYPGEDRLLQVWETNELRGWDQSSLSVPNVLDLRAQSRTLDVAAYWGASFNLGGERPERLLGQRVSHNLFRVLGVQPALGRGFVLEEERDGNDAVIIIADAVWRDRFDADPRVIGETILLNGERHTIVGVMPPDFFFPDNRVQAWAPLGLDGSESRDSHWVQSVARLRPGATLDQASGELRSIFARMAQDYPDSNSGVSARAMLLRDEIYDEGFEQGSLITSVAVAFVLLIACANIANLLLARASGRARELALRASLGASRARIAALLLTESLVIALAGGALGLLLAVWGVRGLVGWMPSWFIGIEQIGIDGRVIAYTLGISVLAALIFGLAPALQAARTNLRAALTEGGRGSTDGRRSGRVRGMLVAGEIALALALLVAAGLLIKASVSVRAVELGFDTREVLTFRTTLAGPQYEDTTRVLAFYDQLVGRLRALPGVTATGVSQGLPRAGNSSAYFSIEGQPSPQASERPIVPLRAVSPGYFAAMGMRVVRGRGIAETDRIGSVPVVVINETMARRHWEGGEPIGQRLVFESGAREIVGVVSDTRDWGGDEPAPAFAYVPAAQRPANSMSVVVRAEGDPNSLAPAVRAAVAEVDPNQPIYDLRTMWRLVEEQDRGNTIMAKLLGIFAGIALLLAVLGVYGVMAYSVSQRTGEVGVRMAIGAQPADILRLIVRQGAVIAAVGALIGLGLAAATSRALSFFLFGVSPFDLTIFAGVTVALLVAALAACWIPARRAARVDPLIALRSE